MQDQLVRAISKDGFVKATAVSTRALTERARVETAVAFTKPSLLIALTS